MNTAEARIFAAYAEPSRALLPSSHMNPKQSARIRQATTKKTFQIGRLAHGLRLRTVNVVLLLSYFVSGISTGIVFLLPLVPDQVMGAAIITSEVAKNSVLNLLHSE
jgi:hypothetical protein